MAASPTPTSGDPTAAGTVVSVTATCPAGTVMLGGGGRSALHQLSTGAETPAVGNDAASVDSSFPADGTSWTVVVGYSDGFGGDTTGFTHRLRAYAYAICTDPHA